MTDALPQELAALLDEEETSTAETTTLEALVTDLLDTKSNVDELEKLLDAAKAKFDELRKRRLPDKMMELGLIGPDGKGGFSHSSGAKIHLRTEVYAYAKKENEGQFFAWLRKNGHGDLIKETVHNQTLKAFIKERLEDGEPLPPQVAVTTETVAVLRSPKEP